MIKKIINGYKRKTEPPKEMVFKATKGGFIAVLRLFNRYYIKSFFGPFFTFVFPVLIFAILGSVMDYKIMFSGIVAMSAMSSGITGMPFSIMELKKSVLLKRIGASPVKPIVFTGVILIYFTIMILLSILWLMVWSLIIFQDTSLFNPMGTIVGFFGFTYGNILNIIMSLSIGFAVATISKSEQQAQAVGMLIYFPSTFLSGQFIAPNIIADSDVMNWISRFMPFRYTTMLISESWMGDIPAIQGSTISSIGNPFLIHDYYIPNEPKFNIAWFQDSDLTLQGLKEKVWSSMKPTLVWDTYDHILGYIVPYSFIIGSTLFTFKKFSWSASR